MDLGRSVKDTVEKLELERRLAVASEQGRKAIHHVVESAGDYAHEHKGDIAGMLDKAGEAIDQRTKGKYTDKVEKVKAGMNRGVEKIAEHRPDEGEPPAGPAAGPGPVPPPAP
jgi:hypothetical protein